MIGVGDKVVCIESGRQTRKGVIYTVSWVKAPGDEDEDGYVNRSPRPILRFRELSFQPGKWCDSDRFRKILPDKHDACESEFVDLLKRSKRKVSS